MKNTSFERFAEDFDKLLGDKGDYTRKHTIDPILFRLLGNIKGKKIYDIACGNGYLARRYVKAGAREVWASDISPKLIEIARNNYKNKNIKYFARNGEDFNEITENYFDIVTINMAVFHIKNLEKFFKGASAVLKPNGRIIITVDHMLKPVAYKQWGRAGDLVRIYKDYLKEKLIMSRNHWTNTDLDIPTYVRPLSLYVNTMAKYNLFVKKIDEPKSISEYLGKKVKSNIPFKIGIEATKICN